MRPIRELLDDATCEAIDRWRSGAQPGTSRDFHMDFSGRPDFIAAHVQLFEMLGRNVSAHADGYGATVARAFEIATTRLRGEPLDCWGDVSAAPATLPVQCAGSGAEGCASDSRPSAATEASE